MVVGTLHKIGSYTVLNLLPEEETNARISFLNSFGIWGCASLHELFPRNEVNSVARLLQFLFSNRFMLFLQ